MHIRMDGFSYSIRDYKLNADRTQLVNVLSLDFMRVSGNNADTFECDGWKRVTNACHWVHTVG